jgi:C1A family cysteine protease
MAIEGMSIGDLQSAIQSAEAKWTAGETPFTAMTAEERELLLGYEPGPDDPSLDESERQAAAMAEASSVEDEAMAYGYPGSYDLRTGGYITSVKNQGGCGSCVAFGVAGAAEGTWRKRNNKPNAAIDLSEAHLYYCHARAEGRRCSGPSGGWWSSNALNAFRDKGVVDEPCYPYTAGDQDCTNLCSGWKGRLWRVSKWERLNNVAAMKDWLSTKGPLVACYTVYADFYAYKSGIYKHVSGAKKGGHCVTCVGYNDAQKYWICKNSWGTGFGENGYFKIAYGQCGIDNFMDAIHGVEQEWLRNVRVTGLWAVNQNRNAWVHVQGHGWRKLSAENDTILQNMLTDLVAAKAANRPVNLRQSSNVIKEIYVL